jgi:hypothetical protein
MSSNKPAVKVSEPARTFIRIRRMVHPYEVDHTDTYEKNDYLPKLHSGVFNIVSTSENNKDQPNLPSEQVCSAPRQILKVENPVDQSISKFYADDIFNSAVARKDKGYASQKIIFDSIGTKLLDDVMNGYNTSLMCLGPEGSGKTYTLFGPKMIDGSSHLPPSRDTGLIPRFCHHLYQRLSKSATCGKDSKNESIDSVVSYLVEFSAYEVRSEKIYDLLNPADYDVQVPCILNEHPKIGVYIQNLVCMACENEEQLSEVVEAARASLAMTSLFRGTLGTRDHVVYQFTITKKVDENMTSKNKLSEAKKNEGKAKEIANYDPTNIHGFIAHATFIDLAPCCERSLALLDARSDQLRSQLKMHTSYNSMLKCIDILSEHTQKRRDVPYHTSTLTSLFKKHAGPLGGDNRSYVLGCCGKFIRNIFFGL